MYLFLSLTLFPHRHFRDFSGGKGGRQSPGSQKRPICSHEQQRQTLRIGALQRRMQIQRNSPAQQLQCLPVQRIPQHVHSAEQEWQNQEGEQSVSCSDNDTFSTENVRSPPPSEMTSGGKKDDGDGSQCLGRCTFRKASCKTNRCIIYLT